MRTTRMIAVAALLGVMSIFTLGVTASAATGKGAKCTPKKQTGRWSPWTTKADGSKSGFRYVVAFPKNSGHTVVGGFCHVNRKGLSKKHKQFRFKAAPKKTPPIVSNPPPDTFPPAPPVVKPPANPPVAPPAPPAPPTNPPAPVYTCDTLTVTGVSPGITALAGAHFTALNGAKFRYATFAWGDSSSNTTVASSFNEANFAHSYTRSGTYTIVATITFDLPDGSTYAATSSACQRTVRVRVPVPHYTCDSLTVNGLSPGITALAAVFFTATNGAQFNIATFNWGDGSSNTSTAASFGQANFAHQYQFSGVYTVTSSVEFVLPDGSRPSATGPQCQQTVTVTGLPPQPPVVDPPPDIT